MSYYELYVTCPACPNYGSASSWRHVSDGNKLEINKYAYVRCTGGCLHKFAGLNCVFFFVFRKKKTNKHTITHNTSN